MPDAETYGIEKIRFNEIAEAQPGPKIDQRMLAEIPIEASVELGKTKMTLREVLELSEGSVISLDRLAGDPLDIKVGGQTVAVGEVVAVDDNYGIRITRVTIK